MLGTRVTDITCGFKGFHREAAQRIFRLQRMEGWAFDAEILFLARRAGYRVKEIPVRWVNDESTDETVRIAESLGARVLRRKMDIEGRHRNWAHTQAKYEWVLSLDADERVTPELAQEIQALFRNGTPYAIYAIPRRNYIGTRWIRHGGWYPSAQLKLFKKSVFRWEETTVHPRAFADCACGTLRHDLLHYSYRDLEDFAKKQDRHTTLEAQKWVADRRRMSLGKALWRTGDRFARAYVWKQGFREGRLGLAIAWMAGKYQWVSYRKYRWMQRQQPVETGVDPRKVCCDA